MITIAFMNFVAFPKKDNSLLANAIANKQEIIFNSSGSNGIYYDDACHQTYPNETVSFNYKLDWCSNIASVNEERPYISYSIKGKSMKLTSYSVRNGCCYYCCCCMDSHDEYNKYCCCRLYSFSLLGSNDEKNWKLIHKIEKDNKFYDCQFKTYEFPMTESFTFIKLMLDEPLLGCPYCLQINQIELYGELVDSAFAMQDNDENDEAVSIIGKVGKYADE